jgi:hypothetical protein
MILLAALLACVPSAPSDTTGSPSDIEPAGDDTGSSTDSGGGTDSGTTDTGTQGDLTYAEFAATVPDVLCTVYDECFGLSELGMTSMEECVETFGAQLTTELGECPNFDPVAAQACLDAFAGATCDELTAADSPTAVCETVCG